MKISKGDYVKIKGQKEFIKVNSIYINTRELGCPQILELENNYKIRLSCYDVNPNDLIREIKKG